MNSYKHLSFSFLSYHDHCTMDSTSSPPACLPPFSLTEFRALISAALDSSPSLSLSLPIPTSLRKKLSAQSLHLSPASHSHSRIRLLLTKLKKRVAVLVKCRRTHSKPASLASMCVSVSPAVDPNSDSARSRSRSGAADSLFMPYLPLAAQYERARHAHQGGDPYSRSYPSGFVCASPSPSPSPCGGEPSSSGCASGSDSNHAPPSPTASTFSGSSASASDASSCAYAYYSAYAYNSASVPPYYSSALPYSYPSFDRPWSVVTRDSALGSTPTASPVGHAAYDPHPDPDADPFAKAAVCVVHRSCEALPGMGHYFGGSPARWLRGGSASASTAIDRATPRRRPGGRARRLRLRGGGVPDAKDDGKEERKAEAEDSSLYFRVERDEDLEQLPTPPPSPSFSRRSEWSAFVLARCSTPPPPAVASSHPHPHPPVSSSSPSSFPATSTTPVHTSNLARAHTARTYPLPSVTRTGTSPRRRPSSPFPLPLGVTRKGTTCTN
ncbi:hypothetical protein B0H13DRAFT_634259 [Mycena leptocephala]|nr:hypothetical protein B0H13DRAFT_634259 [Mycena leptocephala]